MKAWLVKISNAKVILSWKDEYDPDGPPFALACTDVSLDSVTVMTYYAKSWGIETGYRHLNMQAIHRFWELQFLTYLEFQRRELNLDTLSEVIHRIGNV